ncbi:hypothetical protein JST97_12655 [bacterium]|nr:hypothetical protein [bacterium]
MKKRANTLAELLLAMGLLALLSGVLYLIIDLGIRSFQRSVVRHNIQADSQRVAYRLTEDLRRTHFFTVSLIETKSSKDNYQRDAICMAGVKDWTNPNAIDPVSNRPKWDRYFLYYCVRQAGDEPVTSIYRCVILPKSTNEIGQFAFPSLNPSVHCKPNPATVADFESFGKLSDLVESLSATSIDNSQWRIRLKLRQRGAVRQGKRTIDEVQETVIQIKPENTFPMYN